MTITTPSARAVTIKAKRGRDEEIFASVAGDADANPTPKGVHRDWVRMPDLRGLRFRLKLTQEAFAERYDIPLTSLRDWEQRRTVPDKVTRTYLRAIALEPETIAEIVGRKPARPKDDVAA